MLTGNWEDVTSSTILCGISSKAMNFLDPLASISNGSRFSVRSRVRFQPRSALFQQVLPHDNPDHCNCAGCNITNPAFQPNNIRYNLVYEFGLYRDKISASLVYN